MATARAREGAVADADADAEVVAAAARADAAIIPANPRNMHLAETLAKRLLEWTPETTVSAQMARPAREERPSPMESASALHRTGAAAHAGTLNEKLKGETPDASFEFRFQNDRSSFFLR